MIYFIDDIKNNLNIFPNVAIREKTLSYEEILEKKEVSLFNFKEEINYLFCELKQEQKDNIYYIFKNYFYEIYYDENNNQFYKNIQKQKIIFNEQDKDILFIIINIIKNNHIYLHLNFNHYINNIIYDISKKYNNIHFLTSDLNWIINYLDLDLDIKNLDNKIIQNYQPIFYVEGYSDFFFYSFIYPDKKFQIEGGCSNIIKLMKNRNINTKFELNKAIIDKDSLPEKNNNYFKNMDIFVIPFSEIENLWLEEDILNLLFSHKEIKNFKQYIIENTEKNISSIIKRFKYRQIIYKDLNLFHYNAKDVLDFEKKINNLILNLDYENLNKIIEGKKLFIKLFKNEKNFMNIVNRKNSKQIIIQAKKKLNIGELNE